MAWTQTSAGNAWVESQALTRAAPTASTDGVPLDGLSSLTVVVEANSAQTLTGGALAAYLWDDAVAGWTRCAELDWTVTPTAVRRASVNFTLPGVRRGARILFATVAVTVSGGTTANVYILGGHNG